MAKNLRLQAVPNGFKEPTGTNAREMQMAYNGSEHEQMFFTSGPEILWTWKMSACQSVATYTPGTGERSLTHLQGGNASAAFYRTLAPHLTKDSTIIFIAGGDDMNKADFEDRKLKSFIERMNDGLKAAKMSSLPTKYVAYWSDKGSTFLKRTGFVFKPDGRYGTLDRDHGEL